MSLRAAAQQALEALEAMNPYPASKEDQRASAITALRAALAESTVPSDCADSHQPVAWMVYTEGGTSAYVTDNPNDLVGAYRALPLYTAPPQRQPLTIEQITAIWAQLYPGAPLTRLALKIVRAVEAHHGIGGDK